MVRFLLCRYGIYTICIIYAAAIIFASPNQVGDDLKLLARAKYPNTGKPAADKPPPGAKPGTKPASGAKQAFNPIGTQIALNPQGSPTSVSVCLVSGAPVPSASAKNIPTAAKNAIMGNNNTLIAGPWNPFCEQIHNIKGYLACKACDVGAGVALGLADAACVAEGSVCTLVGPEGYAACVAACVSYASYTYYTALVKCVCLHIDCSDKKAQLLRTAPGLYIANSLFNFQLAGGGAVLATTNAQVSGDPSKITPCPKSVGGFPPPIQENGATYGFVTAGPAVAPLGTPATSKLKVKRGFPK
ncbi:hypothetical protein MMC13_003037 [Lambiella insularis]|nr:hypothetical protein [Lambiella insularis]